MALVKTKKSLYDPSFDENTGKYVDVCPYKKHERNRIMYSCRCDVSVIITTRAQFCSHIKSNKHQELLENFKQYSTPSEEVEKELRQYRVDKELLTRQKVILQEKAVKLMEELIKIREENEKMINEKEAEKKKRELMRKNIKELNAQNKNKDREIENLKSEILKKDGELKYINNQLTIEDNIYKEIINFE